MESNNGLRDSCMQCICLNPRFQPGYLAYTHWNSNTLITFDPLSINHSFTAFCRNWD